VGHERQERAGAELPGAGVDGEVRQRGVVGVCRIEARSVPTEMTTIAATINLP